jgi:hypothetical protein
MSQSGVITAQPLIRVALSKEQLALGRVISMETTKFPELGTRFHDLGPKRGEERLAAYLMKQIERRASHKTMIPGKWRSTF